MVDALWVVEGTHGRRLSNDEFRTKHTHPRKKQGWVATIVEPRRKKDTTDPMAEPESPPDRLT
jgi:hypothetical protein